jgi:hypothetical protein
MPPATIEAQLGCLTNTWLRLVFLHACKHATMLWHNDTPEPVNLVSLIAEQWELLNGYINAYHKILAHEEVKQ